ncbi:MAG TPA: FtsX-like permease family protein [Streptosporangiaceae bacterium]
MRPGPVARAVRGGLSRRRVQTVVIGLVVLISTAACTLALGLLVDSSAPFDHAFAAQRGAHVATAVDPAKATPAQIAATRRLPGVTAVSGPFAEVVISGQVSLPGVPGQVVMPSITLAGRASPGGPVDDITLDSGRWVKNPGEVVASRDLDGPTLQLGQQITVTGVPGTPRLTVVGIAKSITDSAGGWVMPAEIAAPTVPGTPPSAQVLYRFAAAGTAAQVRADLAEVRAALPAGAVTGGQSYLPIRLQASESLAPIVPFVVAFGIIGLVMSVLIVSNVVSGAVVAGYRRIGILKSIGFTPAQVVAAYVGQVVFSAVIGCLAGVGIGNLLSVPLLSKTANVYGVGVLTVPTWVSVLVPAAVCVLVGIAALLPALRAGRLSAIQAIATGRAPRRGRGYAAHRLLGRLRLPRPVTIGLAAPFARPARTAVTLVAIMCGAGTVTFAVGLSSSLSMVAAAISHSASEPVQIALSGGFAHIGGPKGGPKGGPVGGPVGNAGPGPQQSPAAQQRAVEAALRAEPGTLRYVAEAVQEANVPGLAHQIPVHAFRGPATWTGYDLISGRWYRGSGEVVVPTYFLTVTGKAVGDTVTITVGGAQIPVRIVGEVFDTENRGLAMLTDWPTLARAIPRLAPQWYDVALRPGTNARAYANAIGGRLGPGFDVSVNTNDPFFLTLVGMIGLLTLMLALVAGLGVLNTVVLSTRERVHDIGVFKALGMTPRQIIVTVVCWVAGTGLAAGLLAVPAGIALHRYVLPVMARSAGTNVPASFLHVYRLDELALLGLSGLVIAVLGALLPAGWAAKVSTASALRAE